jgi:hypothetical protein
VNNVRFNYLYRDASNYLQRAAVVFANANDFSLPDVEIRLRRALMSDGTFAAHQIRLPELFLYAQGAASLDDHCLHEFFGLGATAEQPDDRFKRRFPEFLDEVERASQEGWLGFDPHSSSPTRRYVRFST